MNGKAVHRWLGWLAGSWFVLVSLSGALLLYKNPLLAWQYPELRQAGPVASVTHWGPLLNQLQQDPAFRYAKLPAADALWLEAVTHDDIRHYYDQGFELLLVRAPHSDLIGWLYDFHLHLLLGELGHEILGYLGLSIVALIGVGLYLWWPRQFRRQLWRLPLTKLNLRTLRQWHTSLGSLFTPLLLLATLTGVLMVFNGPFRAGMNWLFTDPPLQMPSREPVPWPLADTDWPEILQVATRHWPQMDFRLLSFRQQETDAVSFRAKATDEWHPNGRGVLILEPGTRQVLLARTAESLGQGHQLSNAIYPLHIAAVGGNWYKIPLLLTGLLPLLLMTTGLVYYLKRPRS
ncbi:PepSY-associated TM helix domain-containing protein [Bowmanella dokdonensis]|uniref:PepSY domain-containing protein n=1 Tax=Bowmanella dokdonensis TaxID=751969 RepID=A0A939IMI5_9ALTE|nr:PepSY-associated TM helix domain-containing protein [Bowmanella dokdonensis]MBN7825343.1 PepSY domain-containing protein [Bowmanella dokdonensis]